MAVSRKKVQSQTVSGTILRESARYGPVITFAVMAIMSFGLLYIVYSYLLSGWTESIDASRQQVVKKELDNKTAEKMISEEPQFKAKYDKIVSLYQEAKPLLPEETEVSDVLAQVETAAQRNGVTLTGLTAVKESAKSPKAEKVYEREIPALVTGDYPKVVSFFTDISRMPRILVVRDYSIVSLKSGVSAGFTMIAYHAPPPTEATAPPNVAVANQPNQVNQGANNAK